MNERVITAKALNQLEFQTGLVGRVSGYAPATSGCEQSALIKFDNSNAKLIAELREWAAFGDAGKMVAEVTHGYQKLLICDYISDEEGARLRESNINYLDNVGNAYLDIPPIFVLIQGKKPKGNYAMDKGAKLFTETGLKVVLALLANRELLNASYREIADHANVSMGTIGWVLRELKRQGFTDQQSGHIVWRNRRKLQKKWVEEYPELKQKVLHGVYYSKHKHWWQTVDLESYDAVLGGEVAAVDYSAGFEPNSGEIYVGKHKQNALVKDLGLVAADQPQGPYQTRIEVLGKFWGKTAGANLFGNLVHPLISYASLMDTWDPAIRRVANEIEAKYLK